MRRIYCILIILLLVPHASLQSQDLGRKTGLGIRLIGDLRFNKIGSFYQQTDNKMYYNVPVNHYLGSQLGVFYKLYFDKSKIFIEGQLTGLYLGQKKENAHFYASFHDDYEDVILNDDMNEWGGSLSMVSGLNFPIGQDFSIEAFTGPEVRCAFSCKNEEDKDLLDWHYNRWQMRWKLGTGFNYRHVGVQVYGSYDVTKKSKQVNTRDFTLSLALGYKF